MVAKHGVSQLRDDSRVSHAVIRIRFEESCAGRPTLQVVEPELDTVRRLRPDTDSYAGAAQGR